MECNRALDNSKLILSQLFKHNCKFSSKKKSQLNLLRTYPPKSFKRMHEDYVDQLD